LDEHWVVGAVAQISQPLVLLVGSSKTFIHQSVACHAKLLARVWCVAQTRGENKIRQN
jgi:hypothetical protein